MRKKSFPYYFLVFTSITGIVLLPFAIYKRSFKDWVIVYLVSIIGNVAADHFLVSKGYLKYKKKLFPKYKIHLSFDVFLYPLMLLYYNQWTLNSGPIGMIFKLFPIAIPQVVIESIAAQKTKLIDWRKGWSWKHSFFSILLKLLICRGIIGIIRILNKGKTSVSS